MSNFPPLRMVIDHSGDPRIEINGVNFAWNVDMGGIKIHEASPSLGNDGETRVSITFVVDELTVTSRHPAATRALVGDPGKCGGAQ